VHDHPPCGGEGRRKGVGATKNRRRRRRREKEEVQEQGKVHATKKCASAQGWMKKTCSTGRMDEWRW